MSTGLSLGTRRQTLRLLEAKTSLVPRIRALHKQPSLQMPPQPQQQATTSASNPFLLEYKHGDFKAIQSSRSDFNRSLGVEVSKTPDPNWVYGKGVNDVSGRHLQHVEIDPYQQDRALISNYRLLIAGIPRPISFVSTISKDGERNLAPFSYFQVVDHDPPILVIGFSARKNRLKDTRKNLIETGECVINVVSEHMIEAVNGTSLDVPSGISEWGLSGLQAADSSTVKPQRVKDAIFSIEGKLLEMKELDYGREGDGQPHGALAIIKATRFWIREDALNETHDDIDLNKMKPLVQLGGISYGRVRETFELPRPGLEAELKDEARGLRQFLVRDQTAPETNQMDAAPEPTSAAATAS